MYGPKILSSKNHEKHAKFKESTTKYVRQASSVNSVRHFCHRNSEFLINDAIEKESTIFKPKIFCQMDCKVVELLLSIHNKSDSFSL